MISPECLPRLFPQIDVIKDPDLRRRVVEAWSALARKSHWDRFEDIPAYLEASVTNLTHTQHVIDATLQFADSLEEAHGVILDRDLLVAAGILMDASKMLEYSPTPDGGCAPSPLYGMLPHATLGAVAAIEAGLPETVVDIILTHSPRVQRQPASLEGRVLRTIDEADAIAIGGL